MAFEAAKTSLGFIEDKLRRFFNLAGTIGATFQPVISPVFIAGDAREPGLATFKGRRWCWTMNVDFANNGVAGDTIGLTWPVDMIIRAISVDGLGAAADATAYYITPDDAALAAWVGNRPTGTWLENKNTATDTTPLLDRAAKVGGIAIANANQKAIATWVAPNLASSQNSDSWRPIHMHAVAGSAILIQPITVAGSKVRASIYGEIF